jgi:hypothetical protein
MALLLPGPIGSKVYDSVDELQSADLNKSSFVKQYYKNYSAEADLSLLSPVNEGGGGGWFFWDKTVPKTLHDGGLFISPTVPYDGTRSGLEDFLNGVGETDPTGSGVWVRQFTGHVFASFYGAVGNNIADDQPPIQKALDRVRALNLIAFVGAGNVFRTKTVEITGTCRVKKFLAVPAGVRLYGSDHTLSYPNQNSGFRNDYNYVNGPVIYADAECELFNERVATQNKQDNCVIIAFADSSAIEGIVVDGYDLPYGSWFPSIYCRNPVTNLGASNSFEGLLKVIDPDDSRQAGNLRITTEQVPAFYLGNSWHAGYQLMAAGGNRTGIGPGTTTFTDINPANPYQWDVIEGTLPSGVSVSKSGWVTCSSPTTPSETFIKLRVADASGASRTKDLIFQVMGKYINPEASGSLPPATVNTGYLYQPTLVNDDGVPHYWWLINGPKGLVINRTTGVISGTPDALSFGEYKIKIAITTQVDTSEYNRNALIDSIEYDFEVTNSADIRLTIGRLPNATLNTPYQGVLYAFGGVAPYTWEIDTTATLPFGFQNTQPGFPTTSSPGPGLTFTGDGSRAIVSGTPTSTGGYHFQVKVTDSLGRFFGSLVIFSVAVAPQPQLRLPINTNIPVAVKGQPYSYQVTATQDGCTFEGVGFPTGISMNAAGLISGTPTGAPVANGISCTFGAKVSKVHSRNFKTGAGIKFNGKTNVHIFKDIFLSSCDVGMSSDNMFDSRFESFYIFQCRIGMEMGGGTAANTYINGRIEYIYEFGTTALFANDNIFTAVYWDTCGLAAITTDRCKNWTIGDCVFYRSGRRVAPRGKNYDPESFSKWSTHINLLQSDNFTISGNTFIRGSQDEGGSAFLRRYEENSLRDWVRPYTCLNLEDSKKVVVTGNNMAGCTRESVVSQVVPFLLTDNDITLENNIVQYRNAFNTIKTNYKETGNIFANANKANFTSEGDEEASDEFFSSTSLLLHGNELVDRSARAYTLSSTDVTVNSSSFAVGTGSLSFNGSSSVLSPNVSDNASSSAGFYFGHAPWTIDLIVNPTRNNVPQTLIDFGTNNESTTFAIALDANGKLVLARNRTTGGQTTDFVSTETIPTGQFTYISVCKTGNTLGDVRIYINSLLVGTLLSEFDNRFIISGFNRPVIGRGGFTSATDFYQGLIQEVRITKGVSRYGTLETIPTQTKPWPDANFGVVSANTLIYAPKVGVSKESYWGDRSYSVKIGPISSIAKPLIITRKSKVDIVSELRSGNGSFVSGLVNPGKYYYNITKQSETGATVYAYQECEFRTWLVKLGDVDQFNEMRGNLLNIVFYARANNLERVSIFNEFYAGTSDNNFAVDGGFFTQFTLTPFWRKYYFTMEFPAYELVRLNASNCNALLKFVMDDKSKSYDWDFGGFMIYPADGKFGHRRFIE